jgi:AcrR family transcriptional regulator
MEANDRRVKRTEKLLMDSLISLSLKKGYDQVTIKDITDQADIAYSTFFRHYPDKPALLAALVGEAVNSLRDLLSLLPDKNPEDEGKLLFQHVEEHEALYRVIFSSHGISNVLQPVLDDIKRELVKQYRSYEQVLLPPDVVANHVVTSILAMVRWWLDSDRPYSVERMGHIYSELIIKATARSAFNRENTR